MNKYVSNTFDSIKIDIADFKKSVISTLEDFRKNTEQIKAEAAVRKDEEAYLSEKLTIARNSAKMGLNSAESTLADAVKGEIASLRKDLEQHIMTMPSPAFLTILSMYSDFGVRLSRAEFDALVQRAAGNPLALKAINAVSDKVGCEWTVQFTQVEEYEKDLAFLEKFVDGGIVWADYENDHMHLLTEVLDTIPDKAVFELSTRFGDTELDNSAARNSFMIGLTIQRAELERNEKKIDEMSDRWSRSMVPVVFKKEAYKTSEIPEVDFVKDHSETIKSATTVTEDHSIRLAKELSDSKAKQVSAAEVIDRYSTRY